MSLYRVKPRTALTALFAALMSAGPAAAQQEAIFDFCRGGHADIGLGTWNVQLARAAQMAGAAPVTSMLLLQDDPAADPRAACGLVADDSLPPPLEARLVPARLFSAYRSGYPGGGNDGALWQGRGLAGTVLAGATAALHAGPVTFRATIAPTISWQQNLDFDTVGQSRSGMSPFASGLYTSRIDMPERFGDKAFTTINPGQSYVRAEIGRFAAGFSTQNRWFGPALRNPLLLSNNAPGFPHGFAGTLQPLKIGSVRIEGLLMFGQLKESEYFTISDADDLKSFAGFSGNVLIGNFGVGVARTFVRHWVGIKVDRFFDPLFQNLLAQGSVSEDNPFGNSPGNQLASLFARWTFPGSQLEIYGEYGREDHADSFTDLVQEPEHSSAYTLGLQKLFGSGDSRVQLVLERTLLQHMGPQRQYRPLGIWYTHAEGNYTNRGQVLGAEIGPGSDSHFLALNLLLPRRSFGIYIDRVRRNEYIYYFGNRIPDFLGNHDVELTAGIRHNRWIGPVQIEAALAYASRANREFLEDDSNLELRLQASAIP